MWKNPQNIVDNVDNCVDNCGEKGENAVESLGKMVFWVVEEYVKEKLDSTTIIGFIL